MRNLKEALGATLVACLLLAAVGASSAMAEEVSAKFSAETIKVTTPGITVTARDALGATESKNCTLKGGTSQGTASGGGAYFGNSTFNTVFNCDGGTTLEVWTMFAAKFDTSTSSYSLVLQRWEGGLKSPFGTYLQWAGSKSKSAWVNGSGATNSTFTANQEYIGSTASKEILLTGTFTATTSTGGLLTLSH